MSAHKIAVVTGGSTGIGLAVCQHFLDAGYEVVSMARRAPDIKHPKLATVQVDLGDIEATKQASAEVAAQYGPTTLVHNAGVIRPALLGDVDVTDLDFLTHLHLSAAITLVQACLPTMRERKFGRVVLMGSRGALGLATRTAYAATKAGMIGMARTWALELAPQGITVNVVAPGPIADTEVFNSIVDKGSDRERQLAERIPVQRLGHPDDVARATLFFADPANSFVTGQVLYVCGGASVGSLTI